MRLSLIALPLLSLIASTAHAQVDDGARWWAHVEALANDGMEGRGTGTPGYDRAADYVIGQFKALGLKPAGVDGYKQPVAFVEQRIQSDRSSAALVGPTALERQSILAEVPAGAPFHSKVQDASVVFQCFFCIFLNVF